MFHIELRQFPHSWREFNLSRPELDGRVVGPWLRGQPVRLGDRRWDPEKARLTIYEAPELRTEDMGMGRGWGNVTRSGEDVTARLLAGGEPPPHDVHAAILSRAVEPLDLVAVVELAGPAGLVGPRVVAAERAVRVLLRDGLATLLRDGRPLAPAAWEETLRDWAAWSRPGVALQATTSAISRPRSAADANR